MASVHGLDCTRYSVIFFVLFLHCSSFVTSSEVGEHEESCSLLEMRLNVMERTLLSRFRKLQNSLERNGNKPVDKYTPVISNDVISVPDPVEYKEFGEKLDGAIEYMKKGLAYEKMYARDFFDNLTKEFSTLKTNFKQNHEEMMRNNQENSEFQSNFEGLVNDLSRQVSKFSRNVRDLNHKQQITTDLIRDIQGHIPQSNHAAKFCPTGWKQLKNSCYYNFAFSKLSWPDAAGVCAASGGHLPEVHDWATNIFLRTLASSDSSRMWLGLNDRDQEGIFKWENSESILYTAWGNGQPNNFDDQQDCVESGFEKSNRTEWNDLSCEERREFICQLDLN